MPTNYQKQNLPNTCNVLGKPKLFKYNTKASNHLSSLNYDKGLVEASFESLKNLSSGVTMIDWKKLEIPCVVYLFRIHFLLPLSCDLCLIYDYTCLIWGGFQYSSRLSHNAYRQ